MSKNKKSKSSRVDSSFKSARVNFKRLGIFAAVVVLLIPMILGIRWYTSRNMKSSALAQAKESLERNESELALRHLDRFLADHPEDIEVLEAKAKILSESSISADRVLQATRVHDLLIRLDPNGADRLATRRKLIELYIAYGELVRNFADDLNDGRVEANESRFLAAVQVADELIHYKDPKTGIENGTIDASAHRLKAMAYMGQVPGLIVKKPEDSEVLGNAKKELDIALQMDPGEYLASEKLAELYQIHLKDQINARKVLDQMLVALNNRKFASEKEANEASLKIRLSRFRAFYHSKDVDKAQEELEAALQLAPKNIDLQTSAAALALQRSDQKSCRRHLDSIDKKDQDNLRVRFLRGALEFAERHPDEAIDEWRKGLSVVGGGDIDLTFRLASNLILFNRLVEAKPLVEQYHRLTKPNDPLGMYLQGMYEEKSGHIKLAIQLMGKAKSIVPSGFRTDILMSLGHCYELIGDQDMAMDTYKQAANLGGSATGPRRAMARLYLAKPDLNRAIEELEIALSASRASSGSLEVISAKDYEIRLLPSLGDVNGIPQTGKKMIVIADVNKNLNFRIFDSSGKRMVDLSEKDLTDKRKELEQLRSQLEKLWPPHESIPSEKTQLITSITSILERPLAKANKKFADPNVLIDLVRLKMDRQIKLARADRDLREVKVLLDEALIIAPENPAIQALLAQYQSLDNKLDVAIKTLEETVKGANRHRVESWLAWAETLERLDQLEQAIKVVDEGTKPDNAGDHAAFRTCKARILLRLGHGDQARLLLTTNIDSIPKQEKPDLSKTLGDLLQELGDRSGAREAYIKWAEEAPESPYPALKLLSIAQLDGDQEASKIGLELLAKLDRSNEPYGLAARALQYLKPDPIKGTPPSPEDIQKAERLVKELDQVAPDFPVKFLIEGMIYEYQANSKDPVKWRESLTKAAMAYRKSIKMGTASPALPKLIELYMKLKDNDALNLLKIQYDDGTQRHKTQIAMEFDRLQTMIALRMGDRDRAEKLLREMAGDNPDNRGVRVAQAQFLESNGKLTEAEAAFQALVKDNPQEQSSWLELIRFQASKRTPADVARTIDQVRQKYTGDRPELFLALCYFEGRDLPNATREFQKAVNAKPDDLQTLRLLADFKDKTGQVDQVEPLLRKILSLDPTSTWAARNLALRLSMNPEPSTWLEAWSLVAPGTKASADSPDDRLIRATILARSPDISRRMEAIPAFVALANDLPLTNTVGIDARKRLAQTMLDLDRPAEAWTYIRPLADDFTRPSVPPLVIAIEALARQGQPEEAEKRLQRLANLIPNEPQLALSRAWILFSQKKLNEASAAVLSAYDEIEKKPNADKVGNVCFNLLMKFNALDAANQLARKMAARWPRETKNLAKVQVARGEYDEALLSCKIALDQGTPYEAIQSATTAAIYKRSDAKFVKKAEEIGLLARNKAPNSQNILICLATIYHLQGQYEQEMAFYRMVYELNPTNRLFLNNMAWTLCEGLKKPEEAYAKMQELIQREGPAPQYLDTRGVIQARLGHFDQAIEDLEKSVKEEPSALTYYHLSRVYLKANKLAESKRCRNLMLSLNFDANTLDPTDKEDLDAVMNNP